MLVAITGTPGCGKTSAARILSARGYSVISVNDIVKELGLAAGRDEKRDTVEVDVEELTGVGELSSAAGWSIPGNGFVEGHLSHFLPVDVVAVLRLSPAVIGRRLAGRGYGVDKIRENEEAEAIGVILSEALANAGPSGQKTGQKIYEIDTTSLTTDAVADILEDILLGRANHDLYTPGRVDWSEEILSWY